jgi:hypothetical protein
MEVPEQDEKQYNIVATNDNIPANLVDSAYESGEPQLAPQRAVLELNYHHIANLYDMAEDLIATAEDERILDHEEQIDLIEPLVAQLGESTDILCEEFIEVAGKGQKTGQNRSRIEGALRRLYMAIDNYNQQASKKVKGTLEGIRNIADPIVEKIKHHIEFVITIFVDFIDLSLDRIMTKWHIQELKKRQEKIFQMLYLAERRAAYERGI